MLTHENIAAHNIDTEYPDIVNEDFKQLLQMNSKKRRMETEEDEVVCKKVCPSKSYLSACLEEIMAKCPEFAAISLNSQVNVGAARVLNKLKEILNALLPHELCDEPSAESIAKLKQISYTMNNTLREKVFAKLSIFTIHERISKILRPRLPTKKSSEFIAKVKHLRNGLNALTSSVYELHIDKLLAFTKSEFKDLRVCGDISLESAIEYSADAPTVRPYYLIAAGFRFATELLEFLKDVPLIRDLAKMFRETNPTIHYITCISFLLVHYALPCSLADLSSMTAPALADFLLSGKCLVKRRYSYMIIKHELLRQGLNQLDQALIPLLSVEFHAITADVMFKKESEWHEALLLHVVEVESAYIKQKSTFDHERLVQVTGISVKCLNFIAEYSTSRCDSSNPLKWFLDNATHSMWESVIVDFAKASHIHQDWVKSSRNTGHHASHRVTNMLRLVRRGLTSYISCPTVESLKKGKILASIPNEREPRDAEERREFTDDECERMLAAANTTCMRLIITIFIEIGLRVNALCHIKYSMLLDDNHTPRVSCVIPEKMKAKRYFVTSKNLQSKIKAHADYFRSLHPNESDYRDLFIMNQSHPRRFLSNDSVRRSLHNIARDANIVGVQVHPHAFRHTIVGKLIAAGNPMEIVSKFMGHRHTSTTADNYFLTNSEKMAKMVNNPFMEDYVPPESKEEEKGPSELEIAEMKLTLAMKIIFTYNQVIDRLQAVEVAQSIVHDIPDLSKRLAVLSASASEEGTTVTSDR